MRAGRWTPVGPGPSGGDEPGVWRTGQAGVILAGLLEHTSPSYVAHARKVLAGAQIRDQAAALTTAMQMVTTAGFDPDAGGT